MIRDVINQHELADRTGMHVLLLGPYPPPHGGVEVNVAALHDFLRQRQIDCAVINLTRHRKTDGGGVFYPKHATQVLSLLLKKKAEIVHLHIGGKVGWKLLGLGLLCSLLPGRQVLMTLHSGGYPSSPEGQSARPSSLRAFLLRRFDGLIAVNKELAGMFEKFGIPKSKIRLILPFSLPSCVPDRALPEDLRTFVKQHEPILLTVSGLEPEYDLPSQIDFLGALLRTRSQAGLIIIGTGSHEARIRQAVREKPYGNHVLLTGDVPHDVVLRIMPMVDVFLRTTLYDGDSISVREALHFGLPVIATDNGMRPEGVHLVPMSDRQALYRSVEAVLNVPKAPLKLAGADPSNLEAVVEFYRELLKRNTER
jgi:glycogen(starch) synthase